MTTTPQDHAAIAVVEEQSHVRAGTALPSRRRGLRSLLPRPNLLISGTLVGVVLLVAALPQLFTGFGPGPLENCDILRSSEAPSAEHWFGLDPQGCDYYTNVVYGTRSSVIVGLVVTGISFAVAALVGAIAGYYGGWIDAVISRVVDVFFGLPFILAAVVILQQFEGRTVWTVSLALAAFSWPGGVRYMRASVLRVRNLEYVKASKLMGASDWRVITSDVIPNSLTPLLVLQTLGIGGAISAEAGLTFIGIGLTPPAVSWGLQLAVAREYITLAPHLLLFPAIMLTFTVLAFVVFGEALRDQLDPRK